MNKKTIVLLQFIFLTIASLILADCSTAEDMLTDYNQIYINGAGNGGATTPTEDGYQPGVYELQCLIPEDSYTLDQFVVKEIEGKSNLQKFEWWLETSSGDFLGSSELDETGARTDLGGIAGTANSIYIYSQITKRPTTEKAPYILRCHAQNSYGDLFWDSAEIYVVISEEED